MTEFAWVIERRYYPYKDPDKFVVEYVTAKNGCICFTPNHNEALRFARKQDVDTMIDQLPDRLLGSYAAEHGWMTNEHS